MTTSVTPAELWAVAENIRDAQERAEADADLRTWERLDASYDARRAAALDADLDAAFGPIGGAR